MVLFLTEFLLQTLKHATHQLQVLQYMLPILQAMRCFQQPNHAETETLPVYFFAGEVIKFKDKLLWKNEHASIDPATATEMQ